MINLVLLTVDRNLKAIGIGLDQTGRAGEDLEAGQLVYYDDTDDEWKEAGALQAGTLGVLLNQYPPQTEYKDDELIKVRVHGLAVVDCVAGALAGDDLIAAANGEVQSAILARGTDTIAGGSTDVVVTHGIGTAPSIGDISITPEDPSLGSASHFWISGISSTEFTINLNADPVTPDQDFHWEVSSKEHRKVGKAKTDEDDDMVVMSLY